MGILVTGGAGFIGSNIAIELIEQGYDVRILDNFARGKFENIENIKEKTELVNGDIRDLETLKKATKDIEYVLHQAAIPSVPKSIEDPLASNSVNINGTLNTLLASRDSNVKRLVFASSSSVYGNSPVLPKKETLEPNPISPYGLTKLVGERYCRLFYELYGLETISLRYFNIFGPRQDIESQYASVIPKFIRAILSNRPPTIFGDGKQSRDFTFVKNVVEANILAIKAKSNAVGKVFNIACGRKTTINELAEKINKILKKDIKPEYTKPRKGDIKHSLADISRAKELLGYEPKYGLERGLKLTIDWFRDRL